MIASIASDVTMESPPPTEQVLYLERKSVRPYDSRDEYLWAMKEDLAEWFNALYSLEVAADTFMEDLDTGVLVCEHANKVNTLIHGVTKDTTARQVHFRASAKEGSFVARDNIANFITWCRLLGIPECLLFETDDLVCRKNERNVVLCLLEVARRGAKYGMLAPTLVQLEEEIEAELAEDTQPEPEPEPEPEPKKAPPPRKPLIDMSKYIMTLDEMVRHS